MVFTNECVRCGMCCVVEQCVISLGIYGKQERCPVLRFDGDVASCGIAGIVPIGDGCCMSARCYRDGVMYEFCSLPREIKIAVTNKVRHEHGYKKI